MIELTRFRPPLTRTSPRPFNFDRASAALLDRVRQRVLGDRVRQRCLGHRVDAAPRGPQPRALQGGRHG